jgi:hypothetical protein
MNHHTKYPAPDAEFFKPRNNLLTIAIQLPMNKKSRLLWGIGTAFIMILSLFSSAEAITKSTLLVNAFNKYISDGESQYRSLVSENDQLYKPKITLAEEKIREAQTQIAKVGQVKVLKLGEFRGYWGNFKCPDVRPDCKDVDKGEKFIIGELIYPKDFIYTDLKYLAEIEIMRKLGLIELLKASDFNKHYLTMDAETTNLLSLWASFRSAAMSAEDFKDSIDDKKDAIRIAKISAKRAGKNASSFDKAFVTALKFEYNRIGLDGLASAPWTYIDSLKSLRSAVEVTKLSEKADSVGNAYSFNAATNINKICGITFIDEPKFRNDFPVISQIYKKVTKVSLKI